MKTKCLLIEQSWCVMNFLSFVITAVEVSKNFRLLSAVQQHICTLLLWCSSRSWGIPTRSFQRWRLPSSKFSRGKKLFLAPLTSYCCYNSYFPENFVRVWEFPSSFVCSLPEPPALPQSSSQAKHYFQAPAGWQAVQCSSVCLSKLIVLLYY